MVFQEVQYVITKQIQNLELEFDVQRCYQMNKNI
jgi:hypothetical protein